MKGILSVTILIMIAMAMQLALFPMQLSTLLYLSSVFLVPILLAYLFKAAIDFNQWIASKKSAPKLEYKNSKPVARSL